MFHSRCISKTEIRTILSFELPHVTEQTSGINFHNICFREIWQFKALHVLTTNPGPETENMLWALNKNSYEDKKRILNNYYFEGKKK